MTANLPQAPRRTSPPAPVVAEVRDLLLTLGMLLALILTSGLAAGAEAQVAAGVELAVPAQGRTGFQLMPPTLTGIQFSNGLVSTVIATNRIYENGSGVAAADVDGDGRCDLFFGALQGGSALYRNLGGWKFEDITASSGLARLGPAVTGAVFVDVDGDGDADLLVNSLGGGSRLFLNQGQGRFSQAVDSGLVEKFGATSLALGDLDEDGDLDLYVTTYRTTNYKDKPPGVHPEARRVGEQIVVTPADRFVGLATQGGGGAMVIERGEPDGVYRNDGHGHFTPLSWTDGTFRDEAGAPLREPPLDWGLSVMIRDLNGDGRPDIYVCNDFFWSRDQCWINQGGGKFQAPSPFSFRNLSLSSMAMDVADLNRDGLDDLFVADMLSRSHTLRHRQRASLSMNQIRRPTMDPSYRPEVSRNTLFLSRGDGTFAEIAQLSGVEATEWTWGCAFLDVDLDGYEDLLIANGNEHDVLDADSALMLSKAERTGDRAAAAQGLRAFPRLAVGNLALRNRGDLRFEDRSAAWGFDTVGVSHGMILADLDDDGDLDVVVNNLNAPAGLYRNESVAPRVQVRLIGRAPNTSGVGARIEVRGGPVSQSQRMVCGGRYLSGDDLVRTFAAGERAGCLQIEVRWPSGASSVISNAVANRRYLIHEELASSDRSFPDSLPREGATPSLFEELAHIPAVTYPVSEFDDFERQPLLPYKLSQLGPGVSWIDVNQDGRMDLVMGGPPGVSPAVLLNESGTRFALAPCLPLPPASHRPEPMVLGWKQNGGRILLLGTTPNYEDATTNGSLLILHDPQAGQVTEALRSRPGSVGPVALGDVDGDGDLDLFVGTRVIPGHYPLSGPSFLYRNENGRFRPDTTNTALLRHAGMVSAALFTDLDGDGQSDLVLATEWASLRVYQNEKGRLSEATDRWGLTRLRGWWNGVCAVDIDGDGRMDLVASNWGRNTKYQRHLHHPIRIHRVQLGAEASVPVETYLDLEVGKEVPWAPWDSLSTAIPFLRERFDSYRSYSQAGIAEIFGQEPTPAMAWNADTLDSMLFLNRGDRFEPIALPDEAQFAPAFGVCAADFNGDGRMDVFLAQNFFGTPTETSRYDGGRGLLLLGDGGGRLRPVSGAQSGVIAYGQQRGVAVADFDADGRSDMALAEHGGRLRIYHNRSGVPGLRVSLVGPAGNPDGIGAWLRLGSGRVFGAAQEVHAGGGFLSQDSPVLVLHHPLAPDQLAIRWPGHPMEVLSLPRGAKEISVTFTGEVRAIK